MNVILEDTYYSKSNCLLCRSQLNYTLRVPDWVPFRGPFYYLGPLLLKKYPFRDPMARTVFKQEVEEEKLSFIDGTRYLGAPIGKAKYRKEFIKDKLSNFNAKINKLTGLWL